MMTTRSGRQGMQAAERGPQTPTMIREAGGFPPKRSPVAIVQGAEGGSGGAKNSARSKKAQQESPFGERQNEAYELVNSTRFDLVVAAVIWANAIAIGVEQTLDLEGKDTAAFYVLENIFLCLYILELALRVFALGPARAVNDVWIRFDTFLVGMGILATWILEPAVGDKNARGIGLLLVFRTIRVLRLLKTVRLFVRMQEFWMIVRSFLNSFRIIIMVFCSLFLVLYIFSLLGIEIITKHPLIRGEDPDEAFQQHVDTYFSSLPLTMLTLLSMACLDNLSGIWLPLVTKDGWLALYFLAITFIIGIVAMSLISAVIFAITMDQNTNEVIAQQKEHEQEFADLIKDLKQMFIRLDADESGTVTLTEFLNIDPNDQMRLCQMLGKVEPMEIFNALDVERAGEVSITQFFDSICDLVLSRGVMDSLQLKRMEMQIETMHWRLKKWGEKAEEIMQKVEEFNLQGAAHAIADVAERNGSKAGDVSSVTATSSKKSNGQSRGRSHTRAEATPLPSARPDWANEMLQQLQDSMEASMRRCLAELDARPRMNSGATAVPQEGSQTPRGTPKEKPPRSTRSAATPTAPADSPARTGSQAPVGKASGKQQRGVPQHKNGGAAEAGRAASGDLAPPLHLPDHLRKSGDSSASTALSAAMEDSAPPALQPHDSRPVASLMVLDRSANPEGTKTRLEI